MKTRVTLIVALASLVAVPLAGAHVTANPSEGRPAASP